MQTNAKLFLIPSSLGEADAALFSEYYKNVVLELNAFIVENIKTARRFLRSIGYTKNFDEITFFEIDKHNNNQDWSSYLKELLAGNNTGLLSEAGAPAVADPGAEIVKAAHKKNIPVIPLVGPSSIVLALMASGLNGQNFAFNGYLPIDKAKRAHKIKHLEQLSFKENQTQVFIETPYRNNQLLNDIFSNCHAETDLCIAANLTTEKEFIKTKTIAEWRKNKPDLNKQPTVFLLLKQ